MMMATLFLIFFEFENGAVFSGYNDIGIPGNTGTRFSMTDDLSSSPAYYYRLRGGVGSFLRAEAVTEKQLCEAAGRESENCDWFLPTDRGAYDIPVTLHDGVGVVRLTALPGDAAGVTVQDASVTALYTDWEYFYE